MGTGCRDRVIPDGVALGARASVERALHDALAASVGDHVRQIEDHVVEPELRGGNCRAHLGDLERVFDEPQLAEVA